MKPYTVILCVRLNETFTVDDETVVGYYLNLGVAADTTVEAATLAELIISDGIVDWASSEVYEAVQEITAQNILDKYHPDEGKVVWYKSGRVFFPDE